MISANDLKPGVVFEHKGSIWKVVEYAHIKPGKGPAFVRVKIRDLRSGAIVEETSRTDAKFQDVRVEARELQYLFGDEHLVTFMDTETYEQFEVAKETVEDELKFIREGDKVKGEFNGQEIISIVPPIAVVLEVVETEPGVRGDTVSNTTKPATVETGAVVKVPLFVNSGDKIKIDTRTGEYLERAKD
ncbi:MAG: elongation factor P [bacterium]